MQTEPAYSLLERFSTPVGKSGVCIEIKTDEVTSLCPITGQPDWCALEIEYYPDLWCVESKSLKLYLLGYRNYGIFHEAMVQRICDDLVIILDPEYIEVRGQFKARGGISFNPTAVWSKIENPDE